MNAKPAHGPTQPIKLPPELAAQTDYQILRELGRGGMGIVYLARNRVLERLEVLKVLNTTLLESPAALERFQQEIRSAANLNHPHIVAAYRVFRPGGLLVLCMEYVDGQDLAKIVEQHGPLPVAHAAYYAHQTAMGLAHAHQRRMMHRDIKPNNLILACGARKHVVKILDFGLAKVRCEQHSGAGLTGSDQLLGTPDYMAPEQILDPQSVDIRADIYSLGCTLYCLLSGAPPFQSSNLYDILRAHRTIEAPPLNRVRPDLSGELAAIVARAMAKDVARRFQVPRDFARALVPFFNGSAADQSIRASLPMPISPVDAGVPIAEQVTAPPIETPRVRALPQPVVGALRAVQHAPLRAAGPPAARSTRSGIGWRGWLLLAAICFLAVSLVHLASRLLPGRTIDETTRHEPAIVSPRQPPIPTAKARQAHPLARLADSDTSLIKPALQAAHADDRPPMPPAIRVVALRSAQQSRADQQTWAARLGIPIKQTNSIGTTMVLLPPGEFLMGSTEAAVERFQAHTLHGQSGRQGAGELAVQANSELPAHRTRLSKPLLMAACEITVDEFRKFVAAAKYQTEAERDKHGGQVAAPGGWARSTKYNWQNPGPKQTARSPITQVTWNDAQAFCRWLGQSEGIEYRLPTEAEWEYACRAGTDTDWCAGNDVSELERVAWFANNGGSAPHEVGTREPNAFQLYDLHGNVWEWCQDWFGFYPTDAIAADPTGPGEGTARIMRGGGFRLPPGLLRSAWRWPCSPDVRDDTTGFRIVCPARRLSMPADRSTRK